MSALLHQALANLNLQPGQTYRTTVNGLAVEVRVLGAARTSEPLDEPSAADEQAMLNLWLDIPPSPLARTLTVRRGEPLLPSPFHLDESNLAPE